jgi:hypothetical protein
MLTAIINHPKKTSEPIKNVESVTLFVNDEAGHPKPFITVNAKGEMYFPKTRRQQAIDFYKLLDQQEKAMGEASHG